MYLNCPASEFELNHNVPRADSPTESSGDAVNWKTLGLYLVCFIKPARALVVSRIHISLTCVLDLKFF